MEELENEKYKQAKKKVKEIKGFYTHLTVYILVNIFLILLNTGLFSRGTFDLDLSSWSDFSTPFFWGIGLFFHGLYVYQDSFGFLKNWEQRKIKEFMEKEDEEIKRRTNSKN